MAAEAVSIAVPFFQVKYSILSRAASAMATRKLMLAIGITMVASPYLRPKVKKNTMRKTNADIEMF
jgi:hypothetical protein